MSAPPSASASAALTNAASGGAVASSALPNPSTSSAAAKKKNKKRNRNRTGAVPNSPPPAAATATAAAATAGGSRSHSHDGGCGHSHEHGGGHSHSHGHDHGHSHGGDGGQAQHNSGIYDHDHVEKDTLSEAIHYADVCFHYQSYRTHTFQRLERMESDFAVIPTVLQSLVPDFTTRMQQLRQAVIHNHAFVQEILTHRYVFQNSQEIDYDYLEDVVAQNHPVDEERMSRVRSTIRQCVRDWSAEGAAERESCYGPILKELERLYPTMESRQGVKVLVPGSGLGRLVWEVAARGFHATGNEFSYFMLMCAFLILNCCKSTNIFTIFPYVHEAKNLVSPQDQLRSVTIPDVDPTNLPEQGHLSMAAGDWMDIFSDLPQDYIHDSFKRKKEMVRRRLHSYQAKQLKWQEHCNTLIAQAKAAGLPEPQLPPRPVEDAQSEFVPDPVRDKDENQNAETWDVFASCYFIDCATNILEFIRTIAYVLKPGGYWINFGPLLYHFSDVPNNISCDLSWSELRRAIPYFGLELVREELNQPSGYTTDERSMLRQHYYCVSCSWKKVGEDRTRKPTEIPKTLTQPISRVWKSRMMMNEMATLVAIEDDQGQNRDQVRDQDRNQDQDQHRDQHRYLHSNSNPSSNTNPDLNSTSNPNSNSNSTSTSTPTSTSVLPETATATVTVRARLTSLLHSKLSKLVRTTTTPSGSPITIWSVPSNQFAHFMLQACQPGVTIGKIVIEDVEMIAIMKKQ